MIISMVISIISAHHISSKYNPPKQLKRHMILTGKMGVTFGLSKSQRKRKTSVYHLRKLMTLHQMRLGE